MTKEEILCGESRDMEFKASRPESSIKYTKTVVAFANGSGGSLVFGVDDETRAVTGVPEEDVYREADAITDAIYDSCEPFVPIDVSVQPIDDRKVIVVKVLAGNQRPYYIKSLGRDQGTFVRVAGTTRVADDDTVKELIIEGNHRYYDQVICLGESVTENEIEELCALMKETALKNAAFRSPVPEVKAVTVRQLLSWGVLVERDGTLWPTNAYEILTGRNGTVIQCGVFKEDTRAVIVDRAQYGGALWDQVDDAYKYVLKNIHINSRFRGVYRQDAYEIPPEAIRELIVNAAVHRSYIPRENIQVSVFDDRVEVFSPGRLTGSQTIDEIKRGRSVIRNSALMHAFIYMNLVENRGSGIPRVIRDVVGYGLKEPEFEGGDSYLRVNIYRRDTVDDPLEELRRGGEASGATTKFENPEDIEKNDAGDKAVPKGPDAVSTRSKLNATQSKVLRLLDKNPSMSASGLADSIGITKRNIEKNIGELRSMGFIVRHGSTRNGYWEVVRRPDSGTRREA